MTTFKRRIRGTDRQRGQVFPVGTPFKTSLPKKVELVKNTRPLRKPIKKTSKTLEILAQRDPKKQMAFIKQQEITRLSRAIAKVKGTMDFDNFREEAIKEQGKEVWLRAKIMADEKLLKIAVGAKPVSKNLLQKAVKKGILSKKEFSEWVYRIYLVNGAYIRNKLEIDYTLASHHRVSSYIPQGEIWIDRAFARDDDDLLAILEHERDEIGHMDKGEPYKVAHENALEYEKRVRMLLERARRKG